MSFHTCSTCKGTGTLNMHGAFEDAEICCDNGGTYCCDDCGDEVRGDVVKDGESHYCEDCKRKCDNCEEVLDVLDFHEDDTTCKTCTADLEEEGRCAEIDHQRDCDHYGRDNC